MTVALELVLPLPPNIANARMHWRVKQREKVAYRDRLDWLLIAKQLPAPPVVPFPVVWIGTTLHLWAYMDDDNALGRGKWAYDWLKRVGYIVDDKRPYCHFTVPAQVIDRTDQRLVLTLTPKAP